MRRLIILCACVLLGVTAAQAQVSETTQTNLTAIFAVDAEANMTTAMYSVGLEVGEELAQGWLFPLPPGSTLMPSVSSNLHYLVGSLSFPVIGSAPDVCDLSPSYSIGDGPTSSPSMLKA